MAMLAGVSQRADAQDYLPPKVDTTSPSGVNLADGSFVYSNTDLAIGSLSLERFHLGGLKDPNRPFFGPRMSHNFDIYVAKNKTGPVRPFLTDRYKPVVHLGLSASGVYTQAISSSYVNASNDDAISGTLSIVGAAYVYTSQDGTVYTFDPNVPAAGALGVDSQRISTILYPNGRVLAFYYDSGGQLKEVSDNTGYALIFDYVSSGVVSAVCGFNLSVSFVSPSSTCAAASLKTTYEYTGGLLTKVTDVVGHITTYDYSGNEISCIKSLGDSVCRVSNVYGSAKWQVVQQNLADGSVWKYAYGGNYVGSRDPNVYLVEDPTNSTTVTDPAGKISTYSFSKTSPYSFTDANGNTTNYRYTGGNDYEGQLYPDPKPILAEGTLLKQVIFPEGNQYLATYIFRNVIETQTWVPKPGSGLPNAVLQNGYGAWSCAAPQTPQNCTKPLWTKDAKGNQTDFTYYDFGGTKSEMRPAPAAGAARPLKLYDYVQKYAYIKNSGGSLVAASAPVWLPNAETLCQTGAGSSAATCDTAAPITITTYEYGANGTADNLLLRGKVVTTNTPPGAPALRSCYSYDTQGNKISETSPRAGLTSCP